MEIGINHEKLNKYSMIRGNREYVVEHKAKAQLAAWNETWQQKVAKAEKMKDKETKIESAARQTKEVVKSNSFCVSLLINGFQNGEKKNLKMRKEK